MSTLPGLEHELRLAAARLTSATPPRRVRRRTWLLTLAGAVVLAGGAVATATQFSGAPVEIGKSTAPVASPPTVQKLGSRHAQLDALKQPVSAASTLPADMQASIREQTVAGENPRLGRKAYTAPWGDTFWVVPAANGKVCLLVNGGGGGCSPANQIDDGTFNGVAPCHEGGAVYSGLLPNDATDVELILRDHTQRALRVVNNVWAAQIALEDPQPTAIAWTQDARRRRAVTSPMPPPSPGGDTTCSSSSRPPKDP